VLFRSDQSGCKVLGDGYRRVTRFFVSESPKWLDVDVEVRVVEVRNRPTKQWVGAITAQWHTMDR
jgi:hypothetical protein